MKSLVVVLFLLLVVTFLLLAGCTEKKPVMTPEGYPIVMIDGCEYLSFETAYGFCVMSHKGNCKNPIHIHNGGNHE